jgi:hypothetical protein
MPTATDSKLLSKRAKVVARNDLRDVPEGTKGRVQLVNGFTWVRYWVLFDNGVWLGSIDRKELATEDEWKRFQAGDVDVFGDEAAAGGGEASEDAAAGEADSGGGKTTPSGTFVPQKFLDRAAAARVRLGG